MLVELNKLGDLIKPRFPDNEAGYFYYWDDIREQLGDQVHPDGPCWALVLRDILPGSRGIFYSAQEATIAINYNMEGYSFPRALEAATGILTHYVRTGERLFPDDPDTYARCSDLIDTGNGPEHPGVVGSFAPSGLHVSSHFDFHVHRNNGVAFCWKF